MKTLSQILLCLTSALWLVETRGASYSFDLPRSMEVEVVDSLGKPVTDIPVTLTVSDEHMVFRMSCGRSRGTPIDFGCIDNVFRSVFQDKQVTNSSGSVVLTGGRFEGSSDASIHVQFGGRYHCPGWLTAHQFTPSAKSINGVGLCGIVGPEEVQSLPSKWRCVLKAYTNEEIQVQLQQYRKDNCVEQ